MFLYGTFHFDRDLYQVRQEAQQKVSCQLEGQGMKVSGRGGGESIWCLCECGRGVFGGEEFEVLEMDLGPLTCSVSTLPHGIHPQPWK